MFVHISLNQTRNHCTSYKQNKKSIIIIPKKNVKFANKRNKIRRQIKEILKQYFRNNQYDNANDNVNDHNIGNGVFVIKYLDKEAIPSFKDLKKTILQKLQQQNEQ